jgi:hypothetical protein
MPESEELGVAVFGVSDQKLAIAVARLPSCLQPE